MTEEQKTKIEALRKELFYAVVFENRRYLPSKNGEEKKKELMAQLEKAYDEAGMIGEDEVGELLDEIADNECEYFDDHIMECPCCRDEIHEFYDECPNCKLPSPWDDDDEGTEEYAKENGYREYDGEYSER